MEASRISFIELHTASAGGDPGARVLGPDDASRLSAVRDHDPFAAEGQRSWRSINAFGALSTRLQAGPIEWGTVVPFTVASLIGVLIGSRLASARDSTSLQRWFVGLLIAVAAYTAISSGVALA